MRRSGFPRIVFLLTLAVALTATMAPAQQAKPPVVVALVGVAQGLHAIALWPQPGGGPSSADRALTSWLSVRAPRATLLTTNAQILSVYVRNPIQWTKCDVSPATTRNMLDRLHIDYVIVYAAERDCPFVRGLGDRLARVARFDDPVTPVEVFAVSSKMASTGAPSTVHTATGLR